LSGVAAFDSHWSCPVLFCRTANEQPGYCYCLKRTSQTAAQTAERQSACSSRWTRPCFSQDVARPRRIDRVRHAPRAHPWELSFRIAPPRVLRPCVQRPNATTSEPLMRPIFEPPSEPSFCVPEPSNRGQTSPRSAAATGRRSDQFRSPFGSDRRDPNTLAPNRVEARTTPLRPSRISTSS
jgi:hypothetical protein